MSKSENKEPAISAAVQSISGVAEVPGDKSISHRSLIFGAMAVGKTSIKGLLEGEDVLNTARALSALGVSVERRGEKMWEICGVGTGGLAESRSVIDFGNSGTGVRLMMGLLATHPFNTFVTGDASLCKRPMERVMKPLRRMGADFVCSSGGRLPLAICGAEIPMPMEYHMEVPSAQVKSAVLLAALNAPGTTTIIEDEPTRDHTERMLKFFGAKIKVDKKPGQKRAVITLQGEHDFTAPAKGINVPADPSSAAFIVAAAVITEGSQVMVKNVCVNPTRVGFFSVLKQMGAKITYKNLRNEGGEQVADIAAESSQLSGIEVPAEIAPTMIDEYPILSVVASFASGKTTMRGLAELKVKESNRLQGVADGLIANGVKVEVGGDWLSVEGDGGAAKGGGLVKTNMDHRLAMSFLVMGMASKEPVKVDDTAFIRTSFPDFTDLMNRLGANISVVKEGEEAPSKVVVPKLPKGRKPFIIAIDGPAASGKGTLARRIAEALGLAYMDTGSLYRAVGLKLVYGNKNPHNVNDAVTAAKAVVAADLLNPRLRQERVGQAASIVAAIPEVRHELLEFQRKFAENSERGAVLDGRDIGTVVCPDADLKLFVTASINARARRRHREIQGQGFEVVFSSVLEDLEERDERDRKRDIAPMRPAPDSIIIDSTLMSANQVFEMVMDSVKRKLK